MRCALTLVLSVVLPTAAAGQRVQTDETYEEELTVLEVEVTVRVFDGDEPVRGLDRGDFRVIHRGEEVPIVAFEAVDLVRSTPSGDREVTAVAVDAAVTGRRSLLFLFDFQYQSRGFLGRAVEEALRTLREGELHPSDRAAVAVLGGREGARLLTGFTTDRERTVTALELVAALGDADARRQRRLVTELRESAPDTADGLAAEYGVAASVAFGQGLSAVAVTANPRAGISGGVEAGEAADSGSKFASGIGESFEIGESLAGFQTMQDVATYAEALGNLGTLLGGVEGQKYALLFSQGPPSGALVMGAGRGAADGTQMVARQMEEMFGQLVRAGWHVHGLGQSQSWNDGDGGMALAYLADNTGGEAHFAPARPPLGEFLEETAVSYVLRFVVQEVSAGAGREQFTVELDGSVSHTELRYRDVFYPSKPPSRMNEVERRIAEADRRIREQERRAATSLEFTAHAFLDPSDPGTGWLTAHFAAEELERLAPELGAVDPEEGARMAIIAGFPSGAVAVNLVLSVGGVPLSPPPADGLTVLGRLDLHSESLRTAAEEAGRLMIAVELGGRGATWSVPLQSLGDSRSGFVGPLFLPTGLDRLVLRVGDVADAIPLVGLGGAELVPLPSATVGRGESLGVVVLVPAPAAHAGGVELAVVRADGEAREATLVLERRGESAGAGLWFATLDTSGLEPGFYRLASPVTELDGLGYFRIHDSESKEGGRAL